MTGKTKKLTMTALFAAMILLTTAYLFHIPIGGAGGYIHLGDVFIYLAGAFLPLPLAFLAAAIGASLADLLRGAAMWIPATILIKPMLVLLFDFKNPKILCKRNAFSLLLGVVVTVGGYYLAEAIMFQNFASPVVSIPANAIQAVGSAVIFVLLGYALDKSGLKQKVK